MAVVDHVTDRRMRTVYFGAVGPLVVQPCSSVGMGIRLGMGRSDYVGR